MEIYSLEQPVAVFCVTADSFPLGIKAAHEKLHAMLPSAAGRIFYGISWSAGAGKIMYKAAVKEMFEGEAEQYGCERFIIKAGNYISEVVNNWQLDELSVARTFNRLLATPGLLPDGYCVEEYITDTDIRCMVTLA